MRRYQWTVAVVMAFYVMFVSAVTHYVRAHAPSGWVLYLLAALPSLPIVGVVVAVGIYLRDEKDEYQRDLMVRCLLWATAVVMAVTAFFGLLRSFGWGGTVPPFTEWVLFCMVMAAAKLWYRIRDRVRDDA